jgi:hypothetical protein
MILNLTRHSDGGHSWLEVPRDILDQSGIDVSPFSYYDDKKKLCYLEEDCDAPRFLEAAKNKSWQIFETEKYQDTPSFVRSQSSRFNTLTRNHQTKKGK